VIWITVEKKDESFDLSPENGVRFHIVLPAIRAEPMPIFPTIPAR